MMTLNRVKRQSSCCLISPTNDIAYFVVVYVTGASGSPYPLAFCARAPAAGSVGGGRGLSVRSAGFCARGGERAASAGVNLQPFFLCRLRFPQ